MTLAEVSTLIVIIGTIGGLIIAWVKSGPENHASLASASSSVTETAVALLRPLKDRLEELERERIKLEERISKLEKQVVKLEKELALEREDKQIIIQGAIQLYNQVEGLAGIPAYLPPGIISAFGRDKE